MRRTGVDKQPEIVGLTHVSEQTVYEHVFSNANREVGGVLIGRIARDGSLPMITGAIPAIHADEQRATLTFTQDAWEHVHRTLDREFPDGEQIVGWYHSHPGFGIFLSEHDLFIHRNFFSGRSQIAVVVDPYAQTEGVFVWRGDQIESLLEQSTPEGWTAVDGNEVPRASTAARIEVASPTPSGPYPRLMLALAAVVGVGLGLGGWSVVSGSGGQVSSSGSRKPQVPTVTQGALHSGSHQRHKSTPASDSAASTTSTVNTSAPSLAQRYCDTLPVPGTGTFDGGQVKRDKNGICTYKLAP